MNRQILRDHLDQAERQILLSQQDVERQRALLERLERGVVPQHQARALLESFEHALRMHELERDRLRDELAALG
jgi:hypothetical protein